MPVPFITRVRLSNYRSIRACDVRLGRLTVLVGPNGSGKSNFLDALAFLAEALDTTPAQALESRGGLAAICTRTPQPTDRFAISLEAKVPWDPPFGQKPTATYGFVVAANDTPGQRAFVVEREVCRVPWTLPDGSRSGVEHFELRGGSLQSNSWPVQPSTVPDRLFLPLAGGVPAFAPLYELLRNMAFYNFDTGALRALRPESMGDRLGRRGEHLGAVLGALDASHPDQKQRLQESLAVITPGLSAFDRHYEGSYVTVEMQSKVGEKLVTFTAPQISDGTMRAAGVLAALYQSRALEGAIPLIGIEEPEAGLHPFATGVLFEAMDEASGQYRESPRWGDDEPPVPKQYGWTQVLATTHSADLMDRKDFPTDVLRAVTNEEGFTVIGELDEPTRSTFSKHLFTASDLQRSNYFFAEKAAIELASSADFDVFGE